MPSLRSIQWLNNATPRPAIAISLAEIVVELNGALVE